MPTPLNSPQNRAATLRAQAAAFNEFAPAKPPNAPAERELWLQHAAGFILVQKVRAAGLATIADDAPADVRAAAHLAVDATLYALMQQIDGVAAGLRDGAGDTSVGLTFGVELIENGTTVASLDLRDGDGMCMGFHSWVEDDYGRIPIVLK